ncbi:hypothetical protein BD413DRAFT_494961 [Trametes elegans]|nr:hypothetical protein BD413DRAFT_494961 [Trametes elegans]
MDGEDYDGAFERVEDWLNFDALAADLGGEQDGGADETALNQPLHPWDTLKYDHEPPESLGTQQQFESWDQQLESWDQQFESWDQQFESWDQQFESWDVLSQLLQSEEFWGLINGGTVGEQTDTGSDSDPTPEEPRTGELAPHPLAETIPLRAKSGVGCLANVPLTSRTNNLRGTKRRREEYGHNDGTVANGSSGGKENVSPSPFPEFDDMGTPASKRARQEPAEEEEEEEDGVNVGEDEELDDATSGQNGPTCGMSGCTYTLSLDYGTDWKHILGHKEVGSDEKYHCTYPGCTEKYVAKQSRNRHAISTHWGYHFVCKIARCRSQFTRSCALKVHQRSVHNIGSGERGDEHQYEIPNFSYGIPVSGRLSGLQLPSRLEQPGPETSAMAMLESDPLPHQSEFPFTFTYPQTSLSSFTPMVTPSWGLKQHTAADTDGCISPSHIFSGPSCDNDQIVQSDSESEANASTEETSESAEENIPVVNVDKESASQVGMVTRSRIRREALRGIKRSSSSSESELQSEHVKEAQKKTLSSSSARHSRKRRKEEEVRKVLTLPGGKKGNTCGMNHGECKHTINGDPKDAKKHFNTVHKNPSDGGRFRCTFGQCTRHYGRKGDLLKHVISNHWKWGYVCKFSGCHKRFGRVDLLSRHAEMHIKN